VLELVQEAVALLPDGQPDVVLLHCVDDGPADDARSDGRARVGDRRAVSRVAVTRLQDKTFYAAITFDVGDRLEELDARPRDAINPAVRVGAPIFADVDVLAESATTKEDFAALVERDAAKEGFAVPPGTWRSVSAELLRTFFTPPTPPERE
jgi:hypothetical protein